YSLHRQQRRPAEGVRLGSGRKDRTPRPQAARQGTSVGIGQSRCPHHLNDDGGQPCEYAGGTPQGTAGRRVGVEGAGTDRETGGAKKEGTAEEIREVGSWPCMGKLHEFHRRKTTEE